MTRPHSSNDQPQTSRRDFLKTSAVAAVGTAFASGVHAAGNDTIKIGLIGCGGRGTGAATQALNADQNVKLVAMADMFKDRLDSSLAALKREDIAPKVDVKDDHCYVGFDAYKQLIDNGGVDVVLLATPPGFRPVHIPYAVDKGKHVFCEKPMAVDGPGIRKVITACEEAKKKNLAVVSGFCWRYDIPKRETFKRVHDGAIGDIVTLQCTYNTGTLWHRDRQPDWSDMEWQLRNWLYFTWLSGDHITEQAVHSLDKMNWAMKNVPPLRCVGLGGRQARTDPKFGHIFDHFSIVYDYPNGVKMFHSCRQQAHCKNDVSDFIFGTKGIAAVMENRISGSTTWKFDGKSKNMYQQEHDELFASIRNGKPINDGEWMTTSSMLAIMGRMAAYTGQVVTWEQALNSQTDLSPAKYEFGPMPVPPVAIPGVTKLA